MRVAAAGAAADGGLATQAAVPGGCGVACSRLSSSGVEDVFDGTVELAVAKAGSEGRWRRSAVVGLMTCPEWPATAAQGRGRRPLSVAAFADWPLKQYFNEFMPCPRVLAACALSGPATCLVQPDVLPLAVSASPWKGARFRRATSTRSSILVMLTSVTPGTTHAVFDRAGIGV